MRQPRYWEELPRHLLRFFPPTWMRILMAWGTSEGGGGACFGQRGRCAAPICAPHCKRAQPLNGPVCAAQLTMRLIDLSTTRCMRYGVAILQCNGSQTFKLMTRVLRMSSTLFKTVNSARKKSDRCTRYNVILLIRSLFKIECYFTRSIMYYKSF